MSKKTRANSWTTRRVSFIGSDSHHKIHLLMATMKVRLKEHRDMVVVYEGPVDAQWKLLQKQFPEIADFHLVGALVAATDKLFEGQINWLEQSAISTVEAGADLTLAEAVK